MRLAAAGFGLPLLMMAGCGLAAAPQPPSLKLPEPVTDLTAQRIGDEVELHWTMPKRDTDKVLLSGNQKIQVCRGVDSGACAAVGTASFAPQASAAYTDHLPATLNSGPPLLLNYTVILENHAGRSAGPSNVAVTAAGTAPRQIENLRAQARPDGVALTWTSEGGEETVRINRKVVETAGSKKPQNPAQTPQEQTLEYSGKDEGQVLDHDAALDHTYAYTVQRIAKLTVQGQSVEVDSLSSSTITINARDVFPPAVPKGLQAVADPEARTIDLSWQPNTEADLAGYMVYRRDAGSNMPPVKISSTVQPVPSFRDTGVTPGHGYEYSVSAVDHDGNESARSAEVEEALPQP